MNEEIKEILEHLSTTAKQINNAWTSFSVEECKGLYDYITNLQQEKSDICKNRLAIAIERDRLQQENKILKENAEHNDK